MSRQTTTLLILSLLAVVLAVAALMLEPSTPDGTGSIAMLDIGQGDSFLITAPSGAQLLIDGGKDAKVLAELAQVMPAGDRSIDVVLGTHPDADHIGGLTHVFDRYDVGLFLISEVQGDTDVYKNLLAKVEAQKIPAYFVRKGMNILLDPTTQFTTLFPDRDVRTWETNTASVVGRLQMYGRSALFTGDSPISIEQYLVRSVPQEIDVDILKLGHHGSKTSSSEEFLKATTPALALISAGVNNRYGHPADEIIARLTALNLSWVSTQEKGTVVLSTTGSQWIKEDAK